MLFKIFSIYSSGAPFVQWNETICVILIQVIMGSIPVKLFYILTSGSGEDVF